MPSLLTTRFAPSPTGLLHLGHAYAALTAWTRAQDAGGRFLLRIEDIDPARCRPEYTAALLEDLAALGLVWDGARRQSEQGADYQAALNQLRGLGLLYPCFCTRAAIALTAPHGAEPASYPGTCRARSAPERQERMAAGQAHAWRLDLAAAMRRVSGLTFHEEGQGWMHATPDVFGDVVLARKDAPFSYHLCATHDDALQGVTLVTRGEDLLPATSVHRLLQALLDWPTPRYAHHRLVRDESGRRLAKRDRAMSLRVLRQQGLSTAGLHALLERRGLPLR